ncbi:MAG TPA: hypothetical protein VLY86_04555 [Methanothrix sp.]|nr:hypothetical protein [Methanothrix sp.]
MEETKIFLALPILILLACLTGVNGQYPVMNQMVYQQPSQPYTMPAAPAMVTSSASPVMATSSVAPAMTASSAGPTYDFTGFVLKVSEPNLLYVNVTQSNTIALGKTEVLLNQPLPDLSYFNNKVLQFDILGHDILGRPVCDVYLNGRTIQDVYYCIKYPALCAYYGPYFNNQLIGTEAYTWPSYFWGYYGPYMYHRGGNPYWYGMGYYSSAGYY